MADIDYKKLYLLQNEVLDVVFEKDSEFYLTGGTCLHRFYYEYRYSDDLDLFTNFSNTFAYSIREIVERLEEKELKSGRRVDTKDFVRIEVNKYHVALQVDFVNDRVKRFGGIRNYHGYQLDNLQNILSNKITAILSRDNPKDVFDLWVISENEPIDWKIILSQAKEKMHFLKEDLIYRLKTFPVELVNKLKYTAEFEQDALISGVDRILISIRKSGEN